MVRIESNSLAYSLPVSAKRLKNLILAGRAPVFLPSLSVVTSQTALTD